MPEILEQIRAAKESVESAKRTVLCRPGFEFRLEEEIEAAGLSHLVTIISSDLVEPGTVLVFANHILPAP